jgi:hypothetical protein
MGLWAAKSPSPANGDLGLSESVMQRFYFEMHCTRDIAAVARAPHGLGRPTISGGEALPRAGG